MGCGWHTGGRGSLKQGIYNLPYETYAASAGISKHGLDALAISPLHYWTWNVNPNRPKKKDTPAGLLGNAIHTAILEPERFEKEYVAIPEEWQYPKALVNADDYKKACKELGLKVTGTKPELKAQLQATAGFTGVFFEDVVRDATEGKRTLKIDDMHVCKTIASRVRKHPVLGRHFESDGKAEHSIFWNDPDTGVLCRGRPDWWVWQNGVHCVTDLKSALSASPAGFQRAIAKYRYHVQAAMYLDGIKAITGEEPNTWLWSVWEKTQPYANAAYVATPEMIEAGRQEYKKLLKVYAECLQSDNWPGYNSELQYIDLPEWYNKPEASPEGEQDWLEQMEG